MGNFFFLLILAALAVLAAIVLLLIDFYHSKLTKRTAIALCLLLPAHAMMIEFGVYPSKQFWAKQRQAKEQAYQDSIQPSQRELDAASEASRSSTPAIEPAYSDPRPAGSVDGFVISYGSKKIAADRAFAFNASGDTLTARCSDVVDSLMLTLTASAGEKAPSLALRLNNEQMFTPLNPPIAINKDGRRVFSFSTPISCRSVDMLFIQVQTPAIQPPMIELLLYRVKPAN